jgi:16S rRNA (uracil1498-N3)-methyltransferase
MDLRHTHRLFVPDKLHAGAQLTPTTDQAHHLLHVLRLKEGDVVRLFNDRDGEYRSSLTQVDKRSTQLITHELIRAQSNEPDLWLCPSVIKKAHFDFMIEKATELGISELQPVLTHRTQVREINADRIYAMCREAAEQSDRLSVPVF